MVVHQLLCLLVATCPVLAVTQDSRWTSRESCRNPPNCTFMYRGKRISIYYVWLYDYVFFIIILYIYVVLYIIFMYHVLRIIYVYIIMIIINVIAMMMIFAYYQSTFITVYVLYRISIMSIIIVILASCSFLRRGFSTPPCQGLNSFDPYPFWGTPHFRKPPKKDRKHNHVFGQHLWSFPPCQTKIDRLGIIMFIISAS